MKKNINKILLLIAVFYFPITSIAQYCNGFHSSYCLESDNKMFKLNGQSKSALFSKGQTSELSVVVYKGQDYRVSICMDENLGSEVEFKIYENVKKKVEKVYETKSTEEEEDIEFESKETKIVIEKVKELIYDNTKDNYSADIQFTVESTKRLIFEISVPGQSGDTEGKSTTKLIKSGEMGCVGILVEHMTTPKTGFYGTGF